MARSEQLQEEREDDEARVTSPLRRRSLLLLAASLGGCAGSLNSLGEFAVRTTDKANALFQPAAKRRYANPVIEGGHPGPSVCRVGDDFFLVSGSFDMLPGLPIHHSRDLINWRLLTHAVTRDTELLGAGGFSAPVLRWKDGRFMLSATCATGTVTMTARDIMGPWSVPQPGEAVSPLIERGGFFYRLLKQGEGWDSGLCVERARTPQGPFEPCPANPIASQRNNALEALQMLGQGDLVQAANGRWWLLIEGSRLAGRAQPLGSEVLLAPVGWGADGWPVVNEGRPVTMELAVDDLPPPRPWPALPVREEFKGPGLPPHWTFLRGLAGGLWDLSERPGWLRLKGTTVGLADASGTPAFVGRALTRQNLQASTLLDFAPLAKDQQAGLALRMDENHHALLRLSGIPVRRVELVLRSAGKERILATAPLGPASFGPVRLQLDAQADRYEFAFAGEGMEMTPLGSVPITVLAGLDLALDPASRGRGLSVGVYASGPGSMPPADLQSFDWVQR
ncbi:family 43 glycosylhydrolase [Burkholderiaceae bacterium UC74_6]